VSPDSKYDPATFWEQRLRRRFSLEGVGYRGLGAAFNGALYRQRAAVLRRAIKRFDIVVPGASVVELGPGTGYYVALWREWGATKVLGLDITEVARDRLRERFPDFRFETADITERWPADDASADLVTAFDVLFHVVDDDRFAAAIKEAARVTRPGGFFLASDLFLHGDRFSGFHQVSRRLVEYEAALRDAGFDVLGRLPIFFLMHPGLDMTGRSRRLARAWWSRLEAHLMAHPGHGRWIGPGLRQVDRVLAAVLSEGPSTELLVARRTKG
jgi:SAM-dependent methyltransferase